LSSNNKWKNKNSNSNQGNNQGNKNNGGSNKRKTFKAVGDCRKRECLDKNGVSHHDWNDCWYNRRGNNYNPNKIRKLSENKSNNGKAAPQDQAKVAQEAPSNPTGMMAQNDLYPNQFYGMSSSFVTSADENLMSHPGMSSSQGESNASTSTSFTSLCDDIYYSGDLDIKLIPNYMIQQSQGTPRPISIMSVKYIQDQENHHPLKVLFDSGSDHTMFNRRALPKGATPKLVQGKRIVGLHGVETHNNQVFLKDVSLPEFSASQRVPGPLPCIVFDNAQTIYDVIIGNDLMTKLGIDIHSSTKTVSWFEHEIPFRSSDYFAPNYFSAQFTSMSDLLKNKKRQFI
jgi:hypothetical protein